jgi:hypothetical protein
MKIVFESKWEVLLPAVLILLALIAFTIIVYQKCFRVAPSEEKATANEAADAPSSRGTGNPENPPAPDQLDLPAPLDHKGTASKKEDTKARIVNSTNTINNTLNVQRVISRSQAISKTGTHIEKKSPSLANRKPIQKSPQKPGPKLATNVPTLTVIIFPINNYSKIETRTWQGLMQNWLGGNLRTKMLIII